MPLPGALRRLRGRRSVTVVGAAALGVVVLALALQPYVGGVVDWGMDGRLTPGVWEPRYWLFGTLLSALFLPMLGWPAYAAVAILIAVSAALAGASGRHRCPACGRPMGASADRCAECDPLPPRRPRRAGGRVLARAALGALAALLLFLPLVAFVGSGIAWVRLEREEDAFGERARAAAAAGETSYQETTGYGSTLWWRAESGYGSHRD